MPPLLTLCWSFDAATDVEADGLWPIGAALLAVGATAGVAVVAYVADALAARRQP